MKTVKTVTIDKDGCTLLFLLMSENSLRRQHTLKNLGHPVFDTATGNVEYVNCPESLAKEQEIGEIAEEQIQMLADLRLLPLSLAARLHVASQLPTRYIEIPAGSPHVAFRYYGHSPIERDELAPMVIDWLEKIGCERGIHYQYQIEDLHC